MSYDLYLWRRRKDNNATKSFIYSLIAEDLEVTDLEPFHAPRLQAALDDTFPGWNEPGKDDLPFQCSFSDRHVAITTWSSTPDSFFAWLAAFAEREGLTLFDPQVETVQKADEKKAKRIALAERKAENERRWSREIVELEARATTGDSQAQYELGNRFAFGEGVPQNTHKAFEWYERAARGGSGDAMFNLAACYHRGEGTPKNVSKAIEWYERAAESDRMLAPFALGEIYMDEVTAPRDVAKAIPYFEIALENGHPDAAAVLKLIRSGEISEEDRRKAFRFWKQR